MPRVLLPMLMCCVGPPELTSRMTHLLRPQSLGCPCRAGVPLGAWSCGLSHRAETPSTRGIPRGKVLSRGETGEGIEVMIGFRPPIEVTLMPDPFADLLLRLRQDAGRTQEEQADAINAVSGRDTMTLSLIHI